MIKIELSILKFQFLCIASCLVITGIAHAAAWQWIDGQRVQDKLKDGSGLWLIDVRSPAVFEAIHIEGSVNIPSDVLRHKKFPPQKTLILVDDSLGQRSAREAADALVKKGQERVSVLEGGIPAWRIEGLPIVEQPIPTPALPLKGREFMVRGVTADELKWALEQSVPLKLYDLRDAKVREQDRLPNSESVAGNTAAERVAKLKTMLSPAGGGAGGGRGENERDLAFRMKKPLPIVLVFSTADDAEGYTRTVLQGTKHDIRYLIGGYEAMISDQLRKQQTTGDCPNCPGKGKQ